MSAEEPPQNSLRKSDKRSCPSSFQKLLLLFLCLLPLNFVQETELHMVCC